MLFQHRHSIPLLQSLIGLSSVLEFPTPQTCGLHRVETPTYVMRYAIRGSVAAVIMWRIVLLRAVTAARLPTFLSAKLVLTWGLPTVYRWESYFRDAFGKKKASHGTSTYHIWPWLQRCPAPSPGLWPTASIGV